MSDRHSETKNLINKLIKIIKVNFITITLGKDGIEKYEKDKKNINIYNLQGFEINPTDTLGAGDAVFGISSLLIRKKTDIKITALISNLVGAMKTKIIGHSSTIKKNDVIKALKYTLK